MCGIVGYYSPSDAKAWRCHLQAATDALSHRGPDTGGVFMDPAAGVGLGHRRLSILDLSPAGGQPMATLNGSVQIVYNGEIYNFKAVRAELIGLGHRFTTETDTEVILNGYVAWGRDVVHRLTGMFAMAIWDSRSRELTLFRDRLGIKPLYYYHHGQTLIFASEMKGLMAFPMFPRRVDVSAIGSFLHYQYIPAPATIFQNTFKLLPGQIVTFDGDRLEHHTYWRLPGIPHEMDAVSLDTAVETLDRLFTQVVSDHLVSDVALGGLLSGGIDSSLVTALMAKIHGGRVKTFCIGFEEAAYDESPWAEKIAAHLSTDHTTLRVSANDALAVVPSIPEMYDEPFADSSAIPTTLVSRLARSQVAVALSGDGGDEQFCGYVRYWSTRSLASVLDTLPKSIKNGVSAGLSRLSPEQVHQWYRPFYSYLPQALRVQNFKDKWQKLIRMMTETHLEALYRMTICLWTRDEIEKLSAIHVPAGAYEAAFQETAGWPTLSRLMRVDQRTYLPDAMLTKVDRASMATGLEVRVPLLDHRVVAFSASLPDAFKYHQGTGKYLLKRVLSRYVPARLFDRPKMGFGVPLARWLRNELKPMMLDYLSLDRIKAEGLFDSRIVEQLVSEHLKGPIDHHYRLWPLLVWEMWRQTWR